MHNLLNKIKGGFGKPETKKVSYKTSGIRPKRDWAIILATMSILIVIFISFASYVYVKIDRGELFLVEYDKQLRELKLEEKILKKVILDINQRAESLKALDTNKIIPPDPSI